MNSILEFQSKILTASPALYPLMGLGYSILASVHCSVMCSPFLPAKRPDTYFLGRILSYTSMGVLLGTFGQSLRQSLEYQLVAVLAFALFLVATLSVAGLQFLKTKSVYFQRLSKTSSGFARGLFSAFIPCHRLYFFYALAVLSASTVGGGLILLGHSVASMPAMALGRRWTEKFARRGPRIQKWVRAFVVLLSVVNLLYFGSRIFLSEPEAKARMLFCF